jgi:putative DNA primase/helicase
MSNIYHNIICSYIDHGFAPIPVRYKAKHPAIEGWTKLKIEKSDIETYFEEPCNIGILTGKPSNGLVDVDIDDSDALRFAPYFLPETFFIFGRALKPRSHWLYKVPHPGNRVSFNVKSRMIVEVRGNGCCTVFPGSTHPSGELVEFENADDFVPSNSTWPELTRAAAKIAIATVLHPHWSEGTHSRHDLALAVSAMLARREWSRDDVVNLIEAIAKEATDAEMEDRLRCVDDTFAAYTQGKPVSGDERVTELLGNELAATIGRWVSNKPPKERTSSSRKAPKPDEGTIDILTDAAAADAFATRFKDRLVYSTGQWFYKNVQVLETVTPEFVQGLAKTLFQEQVGKLAAGPMAFSTVKSSLSRARINAAVELSRSAFHLDPAVMDSDIHLTGCSDGRVLNLTTGSTSNNAQAFVTKKTGASPTPDAACPLWIKFLAEIFDNDVQVIEFVQRAAGYSVCGAVAEQCLFILIGTGANGKSTFLRVLQHVFGDYAATVPMSTLMEQKFGSQQTNDLAYLAGKRFVVASEGERGQKLAEAKIKLMTGGDRIVCRSLYKDFFEFDPRFKLWLATNDLPSISGMDDAIWRRLYVIQFPVRFSAERQDKTLADRLVQEASGIFNWACEGYREWRTHGLKPPSQVVQSTGTYRKENDSVGQWIESSCVLEPSGGTTMKDLYASYTTWCENSGVEPLSNAFFGKELTHRGFESIKGRSGNGRRGIALKKNDPVVVFAKLSGRNRIGCSLTFNGKQEERNCDDYTNEKGQG